MTDLRENIARMEQELADMKAKLKQQDKLELKGGNGHIIFSCDSVSSLTGRKDDSLAVRKGAFRATKELAEIADKNMVTRNILEAYVHQIQGDGEGIYAVYFDRVVNKYMTASREYSPILLGAVLMKEETAVILCEALNEGEIEL